MDFFKDMVESNILNLGNDLHMECLWFCFAHLIQADLDRVKEQWNSHYSILMINIKKIHKNA